MPKWIRNWEEIGAEKILAEPFNKGSTWTFWETITKGVPGYDPLRDAAGCYFDAWAAWRAVEFFADLLTHVKGAMAGRPLVLEGWQVAVVANVFGWKRRADGLRRYREVFVYVPRKNGKTTLAAGLCLLLLFADGEKGAEVYCAAADREQAALVFDIAKYQVLREDVLAQHAKVYQRAITFEQNNSTFRAISREANTKHGYNSHGLVIDELHAQRDRELVDVLKTSTGARTQPLIVYITTADFERPSICNEIHDYALRVRDGVVKDRAFLPVVYQAEKTDDWTDPEVWRKANPCLGVSVSAEYLEGECRRAQEIASYENTFKRLHLNIRTEQDVRWIAMAKWDECREEIRWEDWRGKVCWAGLDLSSTRDITAFVLVWRTEDEPPRYYVRPWFWVPKANAETREREARVPYLTWVRGGWLEYAGEESIDQAQVFRRVLELAKEYDIRKVAYDPWNAEAIAAALDREGVKVEKCPQGIAQLNAPAKEFEKAVVSRRLAHDGNPVLRWMASNVTVVEMDGNIKPSKKKSTEKIDGIIAAVMAIGEAMGGDEGKSVYEDRGLIFL